MRVYILRGYMCKTRGDYILSIIITHHYYILLIIITHHYSSLLDQFAQWHVAVCPRRSVWVVTGCNMNNPSDLPNDLIYSIQQTDFEYSLYVLNRGDALDPLFLDVVPELGELHGLISPNYTN